jgi:hypothetical protein
MRCVRIYQQIYLIGSTVWMCGVNSDSELRDVTYVHQLHQPYTKMTE